MAFSASVALWIDTHLGQHTPTAAGRVLAPTPDDLAASINWNIYLGVTIADLRCVRFGGAPRAA